MPYHPKVGDVVRVHDSLTEPRTSGLLHQNDQTWDFARSNGGVVLSIREEPRKVFLSVRPLPPNKGTFELRAADVKQIYISEAQWRIIKDMRNGSKIQWLPPDDAPYIYLTQTWNLRRIWYTTVNRLLELGIIELTDDAYVKQYELTKPWRKDVGGS